MIQKKELLGINCKPIKFLMDLNHNKLKLPLLIINI